MRSTGFSVSLSLQTLFLQVVFLLTGLIVQIIALLDNTDRSACRQLLQFVHAMWQMLGPKTFMAIKLALYFGWAYCTCSNDSPT